MQSSILDVFSFFVAYMVMKKDLKGEEEASKHTETFN